MDDEGRGRAFFDGRDYRVRGAFPGDEIEFKLERVFKAHNLYVGRVERFIKEGPHHRPRTCPHPGPCAACPLHDIDPKLEQEVKRSRIVDALRDAGLDFEVEPVVPHPERFGYRQKVKLMVAGEPGNLRLGVYVPYSHRFKGASLCPHVNPAINIAIQKLMDVLNDHHVSTLKTVILRAGMDGVAGILVTSAPLPKAVFENNGLLSTCERIQENETNSLLAGTPGYAVGPDKIRSLEDGQLVDPDSFCQTDPVQATRLYDLVADFVYQGPGKYIDAYAGVGGFGKALLRKGPCEITAIESNPACHESLRALGFICTPHPDPLPPGEREILGLILDPPKKGLMSDAETYAKLGAKRVALVSCDPKSMARDLKVLLDHGYVVQRIVPVDLFGATPAIETVVLLNRLA